MKTKHSRKLFTKAHSKDSGGLLSRLPQLGKQ